VKRLPPDKLAEVEDFIDFLAQRTARRLSHAASRLCELTFSKVWENAEDAAYDNLRIRRRGAGPVPKALSAVPAGTGGRAIRPAPDARLARSRSVAAPVRRGQAPRG
jgi:hypothetical protein